MPDPMVLKAQQWVNLTYGQVSGYETIPETGNTGWSTMYALTRALQHELGITTLSDSFGPATLSAVSSLGPIQQGANIPPNIIRIMQAGLYASGYNGGRLAADGYFNGVFDSYVVSGVTKLTTDMGLGGTASINAKIFKGLLTMNAYVVIGSGRSNARTVQQWLNARYINRANFYLIPCDGLYSRDVQKALVYAIQFEGGMTDSVANGSFGPATQQTLRQTAAQPEQGWDDANRSRKYVSLLQGALIFNTFTAPFTGVFDGFTRGAIDRFQSFGLLPATGKGDFATWASLLVSTGDTTRPTAGADCRDTLTDARIATLKAQQPAITHVGRYITNVPGGYNKKLQPGELNRLLSANIGVWPIFQEYGNNLSHLNLQAGLDDGNQAHAAALSYGLPAQSAIYFAVDFDATGEQIASNVIPYFQGVQRSLRSNGGRYRAAVYGSRNVCSQATLSGGAIFSFVSGMSTGFSGNLGFPLPQNWAFDQIANVTIGSGSAAIEIDRNVVSGRDPGVRTLNAPVGNEAIFTWLDQIRTLAYQYWQSPGIPPAARNEFPDRLVANYVRQLESGYTGNSFDILVGPVFSDFAATVRAAGVVDPPVLEIVDPGSSVGVDLTHMCVALEGVLSKRLSGAQDATFLADMSGWAGDLVSMVSTYLKNGASMAPYASAVRTIGAAAPHDNKYGPADFIADNDALTMAARLLASPAPNITEEFRRIYSANGAWRSRYTEFFNTRFSGSWAVAEDGSRDPFDNEVDAVAVSREAVYEREQVSRAAITEEIEAGLAAGWLEVFRRRVALES